MAAQVNQFWLSPLSFSDNEHSRSSPAYVFCTNNDIEVKSFTDVAVDERTESKATETKFKTEVEENSLLMISPTDERSREFATN